MIGKIQRRVWRALLAADSRELMTRHLLAWAFPRFSKWQHKHYRSVRRAADRVAERAGKDERGRVLWRLKRDCS
jgi:hypothetical protein